MPQKSVLVSKTARQGHKLFNYGLIGTLAGRVSSGTATPRSERLQYYEVIVISDLAFIAGDSLSGMICR